MAIPPEDYEKVTAWHRAGVPVVIVAVREARGSTPREAGATMAVTADAIAGTIGGGRLEWLAIGEARARLGDATPDGPRTWQLEIPLGPEIGQCCGGKVTLSLSPLDEALLATLEGEARAAAAAMPKVLVFGAGHTGRALARALALLPVRAALVDPRAETLRDLPHEVEAIAAALPESVVREAPSGSVFLAMTHSHDLDFLVTAEALSRGDAALVGMIGSATKRAVFLNWLEAHGYDRRNGEALICPIGGQAVRDKRPAVIAALAAAEILSALSRYQARLSIR